jgi:hypothetical protein
MKTLARVIATTAAVAALSILILTVPAAAGVPAPGEQPPHLASTEHPTVPQSGRGAQFDPDEATPPTGSQPTSTTDDYALAPSIPALAVTLLGLLLVLAAAGRTRRPPQPPAPA